MLRRVEENKMRQHLSITCNSRIAFGFALTFGVLVLLLIGSSVARAQQPHPERPVFRGPYAGYTANGSRFNGQSHYLGSEPMAFQDPEYPAPVSRPPAVPSSQAGHPRVQRHQPEPQLEANPQAPDESDLLKNSKDPDYILRNFKTMWVDVRDAEYFGGDQMKAALGANEEFRKLNIRIVDDPQVADTLLKVSYTFAWDYPFQLKHQNTTMILVSGKGEGPFSGPLGAADVARQFVNAVKKWREGNKAAK